MEAHPTSAPSDVAALSAPQTFGVALRELRKARKVRQLDLGLLLHLDHSSVSRLESGQQAPQPGDVERIANALALGDVEVARLRSAYETDVLRRHQIASEVLLGTDESLRLLDEEATEARQLRLAGRPQEAADLSARSARWIRLLARRTTSDRAQSHLLGELVRLLVEQCKSHLDYVLPADSWAVVSPQVEEQQRVAEYLQDARLLQLADMSREGALYLTGRYDDAYVLSRRFLQDGALDPAWQAELLRAAAVNAGYVGDDQGVRQIAGLTDRLLGNTDELGDIGTAFLLEGLARGQAAVGHPESIATIERAWGLIDRGRNQPNFSELRAVQLIRTQLKTRLTLDGHLRDEDERLGAHGLAAAEAGSYDRHGREIAALLLRGDAA